jgi:thermitase
MIVRPIVTPSDTSFGAQWGMTRINAPAAWDTTTGSAGVRVAILDCGVFGPSSAWGDANGFPNGHPDVGPKVVLEANFSSSTHTDDYCNHGTHVAGIAAAITNNNLGVAGVGYNTSVANVKVLGDNGSGTSTTIVNGILYTANCTSSGSCGTRRADVINMSLGALGSCPSAVQSAINIAAGNGIVVVAAAGNNNTTSAFWPASCGNVVSVGASTSSDARASFSNYGSLVDVFAPGESILSTDFTGSYAGFSGTSMASPHVAGLAGLLKSLPQYSGASAIVNRIFESANHNVLAGGNSTYGLIDAAAAVGPAASFSLSCTVSTLSVQVGGSAGTTCSVTSSNGFNSAVDLGCTSLVSGASCGFSPDPATPPANGSVNSTLTMSTTASTPAGSDAFQVTGTSGGTTRTFNMTLNVTATPDFSVACSPSTLNLQTGQQGTSTCTVTSVGGFNSTVTLGCSDLNLGSCGFSPAQVTPAGNGSANSTLTVTAGSNTGTDGFQVTGTSGSLSRSAGFTLNVSAPASPPDGVAMYFSLQSSGSVGVSSPTSVANEDIVAWHGGDSFSLFFDGSDVGLASFTIDAFDVIAADRVLLSFTGAGTVGGLSFDDSDVMLFTGTFGSATSGTLSMYFDGSDVGLTTSDEDVDAIQLLPGGNLLLSTTGSFSVSGVSGADEDIIRFAPTSLGGVTAGAWSLYFDGSDVGLTSTGEDIEGLGVASDGKLYLSTLGSFSVSGLSGANEDVFMFTPSSLGSATAGSFGPGLFFDGSLYGLSGNNIYAIDLP